MTYRRRSIWGTSFSNKTKVLLHWSTKSFAYSLKFTDTKNWTQMQVFIGYLKNLPTTERDYDPENKVWYFQEKHLQAIQEMLKLLPEYFTIDFIEKPTNQTNTHSFIPREVWETKYKQLTGLQTTEKRDYLRWIMKNHPDKGGDSNLVSAVNECWSEMNKKEIEYASA